MRWRNQGRWTGGIVGEPLFGLVRAAIDSLLYTTCGAQALRGQGECGVEGALELSARVLELSQAGAHIGKSQALHGVEFARLTLEFIDTATTRVLASKPA